MFSARSSEKINRWKLLLSFIDSVRTLSLPLDLKVKYLEKTGMEVKALDDESYDPNIDEIALEFDDSMGCILTIQEEFPFSDQLLETIYSIDHKLDSMSGESNFHLWKVSSLSCGEWEDVRSLSERALEIFKMEYPKAYQSVVDQL